MKRLLYLLVASTVIISCKKDEIKTSSLTSLTVGNFVVGGATVKLGSNATTVANNNTNGSQLALRAGVNDIYVWPVGDSLHPYFTASKFETKDREVYSLFLCGTPGTTEGIMIKEDIPYRTDSTAGIRFINLSPTSTPLNITMSTSPTVNEVTGLAYKQYTEFKSYPGLYNSAYTFQVRKADGTLLTSFAFNSGTVPRFANVTLVIRGQMTGTPAIAVTRINQDR
ncbi:MAG TPA: hypothetical protein VFI06_13320 [Chitinophagaceae bacterium]|nr:hypothetical protein [Chitinophagaceae bacterium]